MRSEASPCRHHVSRARNPFVELLIGRNESIPQQLSSDGHKGSAVERLWIHDSQPCVFVSKVLDDCVIAQRDENRWRRTAALQLRLEKAEGFISENAAAIHRDS